MRAWPFEGREAELSMIDSAFTGPDVDAVVLTGPAGMGKTRLARQALAALRCGRTAWVSATAAANKVPLSAVAGLMPDDARAVGALELIRATAAHVRSWGGRRQVAVGVDDAHLLDDASATLVAHLVTSHAAFVIMTFRIGEPVADGLVRLWKEGNARYIELPGLPEEVIDRLIDHEGPADLDRRGRRRLHQIARGNPLALRELLHGSQPGGLLDLVSARLDCLEPETRYVVELVACGEPLAVPILEQLAGLPALIAAEDSGLIVVERSGARVQARLDHPLYGEALRRLPVSRATRAYRALAERLLATPLRRREDTMLAAVWQVEAGAISRPDLVRAGAWQAVGHADLSLAERLARAARAAEPTFEADRLLAEILAYRGRRAEALHVLAPTPPADIADRVPWAITRAEALYWGGDDAEAAHATLDYASGHHAAEACRSWLLFFGARFRDAARVAAEVMDRTDADPRSIVWAAAAGTAAHGFLGNLDLAEQIHRRGAALATAHADALPWATVEVDVGRCLAHLADGQPAAAEAIAAAGYRAALDGGAAMMLSGWALYGGIAAAARGHLAEADRLLAEATAGYNVNDTFRLTRCCLAAHAAVAALRGDPGAPTLLARADGLAHPSDRFLHPWIHNWRAWNSYAQGNLAAAATAATTAADLARAISTPAVEAIALFDLVRLGTRTDLARLDAIEHDLAQLLAGTARALASPDGAAMLDAAAAELADRGYDLHAAEVYTAAAHRHHRHGRPTQASLAQAAAAHLRTHHPTACTPLLLPPSLTTRLTPREREVVLLAAHHTSPEIAVQLHLAVPTVNNNLARAYAKLGITSRTELRNLLRHDPPPAGSASPPRATGGTDIT